MESKEARHISPIPYISHAYGDLLAHGRGRTERYNHEVHKFHLHITVASHSKGDQIQIQTKYE
jgi:hypothetical protein